MEAESEALKIADSIAERQRARQATCRRPKSSQGWGPRARWQRSDSDSDDPAGKLRRRRAHHFVRSFWRLRLSWASLCEGVVANGTHVVQRRR